MAFWKNEGGYTQPVGPADPKPLSWGTEDGRRCVRCDKTRAQQADYDDPAHPPGCECEHCRSLCWVDNCEPYDWRGECLELRASNDLHSRMMERARKLWQEAHPDRADQWPDGAANVAWLVGEIERLRTLVLERLPENTPAISLEDLVAYYEDWYRRARAALGLPVPKEGP
jgi:hypothetical protein